MHFRMANFQDDQANFESPQSIGGASTFTAYVQSMFDSNLTWKDIDWLKRYEIDSYSSSNADFIIDL